MNIEAKEMRMVILGLKCLLKDTVAKLNMTEDDDEYSSLVNDATLLESMVLGFTEDYETKYL